MTKRYEVVEMVGGIIVISECAGWLYVMDTQYLTELLNTILFCHAAMLTDILISLFGFASLSLPVIAVPVDTVAVNESRVVLASPVFVSAIAAAIFTSTYIFPSGGVVCPKLFFTIKASVPFSRGAGCAPFALVGILTLRGTVFSSTVCSAGRLQKIFFSAILTGIFHFVCPCSVKAFFTAIFRFFCTTVFDSKFLVTMSAFQ